MTSKDNKLALKWGCTPRTVRAWRKAGAPLKNSAAMLTWLAARKNLPPKTFAIVSGHTDKVMSSAAAAAASGESSGDTGAASALRRLENAERVTYRMLQTALKSGSPPAIKAARENWLAVGNQLRQYDRQVARDQRDAGELVPRSEMERSIGFFLYWLRMAARQSAAGMVRAIQENGSAPVCCEEMQRLLWDNLLSALAVLGSKPCAASLPDWWLAAAKAGVEGAFVSPGKAVVVRREALEKCFESLIGASVEHHAAKLGKGEPEQPSTKL